MYFYCTLLYSITFLLLFYSFFFLIFKNKNVLGKNMKLPIYPIWVLCSESHYSVLFSSNQNEVNDPCLRKGGHKVDLYYYDELAKQEEMYRLTVEMPEYNKTSDEEENEHSKNESDLTPPIDHVIRTHWKAATVDWNGSEALL